VAGAEFAGADFAGFSARVALVGAVLVGAVLVGAVLGRMDLAGVALGGVERGGAVRAGAVLPGALRDVAVSAAGFFEARFAGADVFRRAAVPLGDEAAALPGLATGRLELAKAVPFEPAALEPAEAAPEPCTGPVDRGAAGRALRRPTEVSLLSATRQTLPVKTASRGDPGHNRKTSPPSMR
jgi:hypothetical protein